MPDQEVMPRLDCWQSWVVDENFKLFFRCANMDCAHITSTTTTAHLRLIVHFSGERKVVGFFTKFGDGACDLTPLSGLVKNQVRAIARRLGAPDNLVMKVPTADLEELRPGKPDEDAHGVSYKQIDAFLHGEPVGDEAYAIIVKAYDQTRHKRELPFAP